MREALKILSVIVLLVATPTAAIVWSEARPSFSEGVLRIACPVLSVLAIAFFLRIHFHPDKAPDYLRQTMGQYFNRGGFCFGFGTTAVDGLCRLEVYFQNQQDQPCIGRIALRPARGFFLGRAELETIAVEIHCEPAAYGVARIAIPVPAPLQGKTQSFEVGASVDRPSGIGRTLRFRDGLVLRANVDFGNNFGNALTIAGALTGQIVLSAPATVRIKLPTQVAAEIPGGMKLEMNTLWKLGDAPLEGFG